MVCFTITMWDITYNHISCLCFPKKVCVATVMLVHVEQIKNSSGVTTMLALAVSGGRLQNTVLETTSLVRWTGIAKSKHKI